MRTLLVAQAQSRVRSGSGGRLRQRRRERYGKQVICAAHPYRVLRDERKLERRGYLHLKCLPALIVGVTQRLASLTIMAPQKTADDDCALRIMASRFVDLANEGEG